MSVKILVVDDEIDMQDLIKLAFKAQIKDKEFVFLFALNGLEALEVLSKNSDLSVIMTDINMPGMSGLDLLKEINKSDVKCQTVVVSAYGDMQNIRTSMNYGALDFVTKPIDLDDYKATLYKAINEFAFLKTVGETEKSLKEITVELEIAKRLQESMLPSDFKQFKKYKLDVSGKMIPAKSVGGDFFDIFPINDHKIGMLIADVSGKNISACIYMAVVKSIFKLLSLNDLGCSEIFKQLDEILSKDLNTGMFVTAFYGVLDCTNGHLSFCNAGHNPPYIIKNDRRLIRLDANQGRILGVKELFGSLSDYQDSSVVLSDQECIFLYTDGVTEALNVENEFFSEKRLEETLQSGADKPAGQLTEFVLKTLSTFADKAHQNDDITMMAIRYNYSLPLDA